MRMGQCSYQLARTSILMFDLGSVDISWANRLFFKTRLKAYDVTVAQHFCGFLGTDLTNHDISPANFAAVGLQLNPTFRRQRHCTIPVIFHDRFVDDKLAVEPHARAGTDLSNLDAVPLLASSLCDSKFAPGGSI